MNIQTNHEKHNAMKTVVGCIKMLTRKNDGN